MTELSQPGLAMSVPALALLATFGLLATPVSSFAQQGRRIDVLTGEPVKPRAGPARPEPEILNAPHAPRREPRADDPPIEIYVSPQMGGLQDDPFATRRLPPPNRHFQHPHFDHR